MQHIIPSISILQAVTIVACLALAGPGVAQDTPSKTAQGATKSAAKPLFVASKDTFLTWAELRNKYGWTGRETMPQMIAREKVTGGMDDKTGLFMMNGRFTLDNLEMEGSVGQGPKGVLLKKGSKILGTR
jgi:hypothetical protein